LAVVRVTFPFTRIVKENCIRVEAQNLGQLCRELIKRYGGEMEMLLDDKGDLSQDIVILVNRRNAHTLSGADTILEKDTEVLIMPYIIGG